MRGVPVEHDEAQEAEFSFEQIIERIAVLAAVVSIDALVGARERGNARSLDVGKRPKVRFAHGLSNRISRCGNKVL